MNIQKFILPALCIFVCIPFLINSMEQYEDNPGCCATFACNMADKFFDQQKPIRPQALTMIKTAEMLVKEGEKGCYACIAVATYSTFSSFDEPEALSNLPWSFATAITFAKMIEIGQALKKHAKAKLN